MTAAIEAGIPKLRIEEAAARTQARIDSGRQPVIGVNEFRPDAPETIDVLKVDNTVGARRSRSPSCERLRAERDEAACQAALDAPHRRGARRRSTGTRDPGLDQNLLKLAVDAARAKATVGEISDALEEVFGRHTAAIRTIQGVYRQRGRRVAERRSSPGSWSTRFAERRTAAGRASSSPRWARTATTAARR